MRKYLRNFHFDKRRFVLSVSVGSLLSFILSFGGFTQQLFVNGVLGQATSLYETVVPSGYLPPQSLLEWLFGIYFVGYLPLSILTCYVAFKHRSVRRIFYSLCIGTFITLALVDTILCVFDASLRATLPESYLSNALGAPVIALVLITVLLYTRKISDHLGIRRAWSNFAMPLVMGFLIVLVLFVVVKNLFWLTKTNVSVVAKPPFEATVTAGTKKTENDKFGVFLADAASPDKLSWTGMFKRMRLGAHYPSNRAKIEVYLFDGCPSNSAKELIKKAGAPLFLSNGVSRTGFGFDNGMGEFSIYTPARGGHWHTSLETPSIFSVQSAAEGGEYDITSFVSNDVSIFHEGWDGEVIYRANAFLIGDKKLKQRTFSVITNDETRSFTVTPDPNSRIDEAIACRPMSSNGRKLVASSPLISVLVRINYPPRRTYRDLQDSHRTMVSGINGWLGASGVASDDLGNYFSDGKASVLSIQGRFEEIVVDGSMMTPRRKSWVYLQGDVSGSTDSDFVRFDGETEAVFLDGVRVSKTRWERVSSGIKWFLLLLPGVFGFFLKAFLDAWKRDDVLISF